VSQNVFYQTQLLRIFASYELIIKQIIIVEQMTLNHWVESSNLSGVTESLRRQATKIDSEKKRPKRIHILSGTSPTDGFLG